MEHRLTEQDGHRALRDHILEKATAARTAHGPMIDADAIMRVLDDRTVVRYPVGVRFDGAPLETGEFGQALPLGEHPSKGFCLFLHPMFEAMPEVWAMLIAYHIPPINYGDIAGPEDCEAFGATLVGMDVEEYYERLCELADSVPRAGGPHAPEA